MQKIDYQLLGETLYQQTLPNGLTVSLLPKADYHKTYAVLTTNYGSIDDLFIPLGQSDYVQMPAGIAHFLEHKMFDKKDGDIFEAFSRQGASANAFTSFTRTSYLFSATNQIKTNLLTLLDFVQQPYFTAASVAKEKGIIGQEIEMYEDDPNWRLFFGIIGNLYPKHPIHHDIAGTVESIAQITPAQLYSAYQTFYQPSNMNLFVIGHFDPETIMTAISANQQRKTFPEPTIIHRQFPEEDASGHDIIPYRVTELPVQRGKSIVGIKGLTAVSQDRAGLKYRTALNLLFDMLFGDSSRNYLRLYDQGIVDDTFGYELDMERTFHFATFSGDTDHPQQLSDAVIKLLENAADNPDLNEKRLALVKKEAIGSALQSLNSLEYIANSYSGNHFGTASLFDLVPIISEVTLADIQSALRRFVRHEAFSVFHIEAQSAGDD